MNILRFAAKLPKGSDQRRAILAALKEATLSSVSKTIIEQMGGYGKMRAMLGLGRPPYLVTESPEGSGIRFMWPNKSRTRGNMVDVVYNRGLDLYNMTFWNASTGGLKKVKEYRGVYAEDLVDLFEKQTGWYLRL